ncbi:hypothetical protein [Thiohalocapsa sp. ML1]|uniref:hypothetical protein n=1 Tax=Thiohalocapsa sp. ML1 TaxID=1431688 RepID=UPI0007320D88|nr:hypothetical protein [Thiohalocapsa sp. ML1]
MSDSFPSLAQHFEAPADYRAGFAWLCGYSADAAFLDDALERFTRLTSAQRAYEGRIWLALMLDHRHPPIGFVDAPGVVHLPIQDPEIRGFRLLHAKVALLGFRHDEDPERWWLRLIVATGNWTRQTLEQSLDLAWRIDLESTDLAAGGPAVELGCADLAAAWNLLKWTGRHFDQRLLDAQGDGHPARLARRELEHWLAQCEKTAGTRVPRFLDNRTSSLFDRLVGQVQAHAGGVRRNYLAMGSGFYEAPSADGSPPVVPTAIRDGLSKAGLLTASAEVDLFVNPLGCQGIAAAIAHVREAGITVRPARAPVGLYGENAARSLHAKFLFSANYREASENCISPWAYLGSGNLTNAGFMQRASLAAGNLEAGVVFAPSAMPWQAGTSEPSRPAVDTLLPAQWTDECKDAGDAAAGEGPPERDEEYVAGPIAWVTWQACDEGGVLIPNEPVADGGDVVAPDGEPCTRKGEAFLWSDPRPRQVTLRWQSADGGTRQGQIPVLDELGRVWGTALPALGLEGARAQLASFPLAPDVEAEDEDGSPPDDDNNSGRNARGVGDQPQVGTYPIRQMMALIEDIAARQAVTPAHDWIAWCARLEQTLQQTAGAPEIQAFLALGLNPLSPLRARPFRPSFAETADEEPGRLYEALLDRIELAWGVKGLESIGVEA